MSHIFISYSKKDIEFARHLRQLLEDEGFGVWIDETQLEPAERWWSEIEENIETCAAFIVIMSPNSRKSVWVEREILYAERLRKPLFPVLLGRRDWPRLADIQYSDMTRGLKSDLPPRLITGLLNEGVPVTYPDVPPQLPGKIITGEQRIAPPQVNRRAIWVFAAVIALIVVAAVVIRLLLLSGGDENDPTHAAVIPPETQAWLDFLGTRENIPTITNTPTNTPDRTGTYIAASTKIAQTEIAAAPTSTPTDPSADTPLPTLAPTDRPTHTPVPTSTPDETLAVVVVDTANVRSGPGLNFNVIGTVERNEEALVIGITQDNGWYQIVYDGQTGWIAAGIVKLKGDSASVVIISSETPTPTKTPALSLGKMDFEANCVACHGSFDGAGPSLPSIVANAATRVEGQSAEEYLYESIVDPSAYVVEGFSDIMPRVYGDQFSEDDIINIIAYILTQ